MVGVALLKLLRTKYWSLYDIEELADRHILCPN